MRVSEGRCRQGLQAHIVRQDALDLRRELVQAVYNLLAACGLADAGSLLSWIAIISSAMYRMVYTFVLATPISLIWTPQSLA